jgi:two-component system, OmpR family, phosphate regulon sensor histidine kinase PhoR
LNFEIASPANLMGEEREVLSAFSNLVSNAIRYTPDVGTVTAKWSVNNQGQGEFSVTDTGPGIASEHLSRLTERFYRVDRSRSRDTGGTGLGLAIVKHIANRHQAQLLIESSPGKGSTFTLRFPRDRITS